MTFKMSCCPSFNYAMDKHNCVLDDNGKSVVFSSNDLIMILKCSGKVKLNLVENTDSEFYKNPYIDSKTGNVVESEFTIEQDEQVTFIFGSEKEINVIDTIKDLNELSNEMMNDTIEFWHDWLSKCTYFGRWRETVHRSILALKLLTFEKTGAIIGRLLFFMIFVCVNRF